MAVTHVVVGLGNPGERYAETRHNIGFLVADLLAIRNRCDARGRFQIQNPKTKEAFDVLLLKPQTFMNLSGVAVREALQQTNLEESEYRSRLIVVHDELDIPLGEIKLQTDRSAGGHNGIKSIVEKLGTQAFARIRVGIGKPAPGGMDTSDWVLTKFGPGERGLRDEMVTLAAEVAELAIVEGIEKATSKIGSLRPKKQSQK